MDIIPDFAQKMNVNVAFYSISQDKSDTENEVLAYIYPVNVIKMELGHGMVSTWASILVHHRKSYTMQPLPTVCVQS